MIANGTIIRTDMNDRTARILEAVIEEFIDTGEPVSSAALYKNYDFGIKPAMIRLELEALEEDGLLEQLHHSAGRSPTDRGYEFFAERALDVPFSRRSGDMKELFEKCAWRDFLGKLSLELGLLGVAMDLADNMVYKTGLPYLVENLDWEDRNGIGAVIRDFEAMDERLPRAAKKIGNGPKVFIGKKSPVTKSENLSVVGGNYEIRGAAISIFVIGPKRMDYRKTIRMLRSL